MAAAKKQKEEARKKKKEAEAKLKQDKQSNKCEIIHRFYAVILNFFF